MKIENAKLSPIQAGRSSFSPPAIARTPVSTKFGNIVDVRNRGALRASRLGGNQTSDEGAPAVVRVWSGDSCRELSIGEARALATQLLEAARCAELQNAH